MKIASYTIDQWSKRECPCCYSLEVELLHENKLAPIDGLDMSYQVGACKVCGFTYAYNLPQPEIYTKYYRGLSKYDFSPSEFKESSSDSCRAEAAFRISRKYLNSGSIIVDIGCGIGYLLSYFSREGFPCVHGLDPGASSPRTAAKCFGLNNIKTGYLSEASFLMPLRQAKLVMLTGVLEHLWQLRADLDFLVNSMEPGSYLLIEVPALERFNGVKDEPFGEFSLEHIQFFSAASLDTFMTSLGLDRITTEIIKLPIGTTDSLFGLYQVSKSPFKNLSKSIDKCKEDSGIIREYIFQSSICLLSALRRLPTKEFILYGAGSHTSRLLGSFSDGRRSRIISIVDSNPNLLGKKLAHWDISSTISIANYPDAPIVVSSFRSQQCISAHITENWGNQIVLLY